MHELLCLPALCAAAELEIEESTGPQEDWAAELLPLGKRSLLIFLHLPTQYAFVTGPFDRKALHALRDHFKKGLAEALRSDGFKSNLPDLILDRFGEMRLAAGSPDEQYLKIIRAIKRAFKNFHAGEGEVTKQELDTFNQSIREASTSGKAPISPRDTLRLWAESLPDQP